MWSWVSWPHTSAAAPDNAGVKVIMRALDPLCCSHSRAVPGVPVLLCRGGQAEHKLLCRSLHVICIAAPSWGKGASLVHS